MNKAYETTVKQFFTPAAQRKLSQFEDSGGLIIDVDEYGASVECPTGRQGECNLDGQFVWFDYR